MKSIKDVLSSTKRETVTEKPIEAPPVVESARVVTPGRIVMYRLADGPNRGQIRPAIVVRTHPNGTANLFVFPDGLNDTSHNMPLWVTDVPSGTEAGTWSWPERTP